MTEHCDVPSQVKSVYVTVHRAMSGTDIPAVVAIDSASNTAPLGKREFGKLLKRRNCHNIVATQNGKVIGFATIDSYREYFQITRFGVSPSYRRKGVGSQLLSFIKKQAVQASRQKLTVEVRERNLDAQLFLKANGFRWVKTTPSRFKDPVEDCYLLEAEA